MTIRRLFLLIGFVLLASVAIWRAALNAQNDSMEDPQTGERISLKAWQGKMDQFRKLSGLPPIRWDSK